jgi:hypothetical protein
MIIASTKSYFCVSYFQVNILIMLFFSEAINFIYLFISQAFTWLFGFLTVNEPSPYSIQSNFIFALIFCILNIFYAMSTFIATLINIKSNSLNRVKQGIVTDPGDAYMVESDIKDNDEETDVKKSSKKSKNQILPAIRNPPPESRPR